MDHENLLKIDLLKLWYQFKHLYMLNITIKSHELIIIVKTVR